MLTPNHATTVVCVRWGKIEPEFLMQDNPSELGRVFWQFEVAGVPLLPRLVTHGKVGQVEGQWWLKAWGERLLFCAASAPDKVFAVVTPCEDEADLVAFWRAAVESGEFGRMSSDAHEMDKPAGWASFALLKANSGRSWARDWCGGSWIEFVGPKFPVDVPRYSLATSEHDAMFKLWSRPFPESERCVQPPVWLLGSSREWQQVLQACATLKFCKNPADSSSTPIESGKYVYSFSAYTPFGRGWMDGIEDYDIWSIPCDWESLFMRSFVFAGWDWNRNERTEDIRASWDLKPANVATNIQLTLAPSQHQQLEARLFLRDWLRGKVPESRIAKLLE